MDKTYRGYIGGVMTNLFDIHCHIIPGVDDGPKDMKTAMQLLQMEYEDGVRSIIVTPHFRKGMFETSQETILKHFLLLKKSASEAYPNMNLYLGCEFHANMDMIDTLETKKRPTMADSPYVLVEFSEDDSLSYIRERCYMLLCNRYIPVIAHAERYAALYRQYDAIAQLVDMGAQIQIGASSIVGENGFIMKKFCKKLMKMDLLHYVGSDAHNLTDRKPCMGKCAAYMQKMMGRAYTRRIMNRNPACFIGHGIRD